MKGGDEFAMQRVQAINKPRQLALYYHPKYGEIGKDIIYLNRFDVPISLPLSITSMTSQKLGYTEILETINFIIEVVENMRLRLIVGLMKSQE